MAVARFWPLASVVARRIASRSISMNSGILRFHGRSIPQSPPAWHSVA
jgi:hypothetical protein